MQLSLKQVALPTTSNSFEPHEVFPSGLNSGFISTRKVSFDTPGEDNPDDFVYSYQLYPFRDYSNPSDNGFFSKEIELCSHTGNTFNSRMPIDYRDGSLLISEVSIDTLGHIAPIQRFGVLRLTESGADLSAITYLTDARLPLQMVSRNSVITAKHSFACGLPDSYPDPKLLVLGDEEDRLIEKEKYAGLFGTIAELPLALSAGPTSEFGLVISPHPDNFHQLGYFIKERSGERFCLNGYMSPYSEESMPDKNCINEDGMVVGLSLDDDGTSVHPMTWNRYGYSLQLTIPKDHKESEIYISGITSIIIKGKKYGFVTAEFLDSTSQSHPFAWLIDETLFGEQKAVKPFPLDFKDTTPSQIKSVQQGGITLLEFENFPGDVKTGVFLPTTLTL